MSTRTRRKGRTLIVDIRSSLFKSHPWSAARPTALMMFLAKEAVHTRADKDDIFHVTVRVVGTRVKNDGTIVQKVTRRRTFEWVNNTLRSMPKRKPIASVEARFGNGK